MFFTLATNQAQVRSSTAQLIATISSIEIPRKEWPDVLSKLTANASIDKLDLRISVLQTLGFICEELYASDFAEEERTSIILALINNISKDESTEKNQVATKALLNAISFASQNFEKDNERDFIMGKIFEACTIDDEETRQYAMQTLVEVGRIYYDYVEHYFQ